MINIVIMMLHFQEGIKDKRKSILGKIYTINDLNKVRYVTYLTFNKLIVKLRR